MFSGTVLETTWKDKPLGFRNDDFLVNGKGIRASLVETGTFLVNAKGICNGNPKEPLTIFVYVSLFFFYFSCFLFFYFLFFSFYYLLFLSFRFFFITNFGFCLVFLFFYPLFIDKKNFLIKSKK